MIHKKSQRVDATDGTCQPKTERLVRMYHSDCLGFLEAESGAGSWPQGSDEME